MARRLMRDVDYNDRDASLDALQFVEQARAELHRRFTNPNHWRPPSPPPSEIDYDPPEFVPPIASESSEDSDNSDARSDDQSSGIIDFM